MTYQTEPPPYQTTSPAQRELWEAKGKRGIGFGLAWLLGGLLLTLITYSNAATGGGVYIVAWGPALYGIYRIVSGYRMLNRSKQDG